MEHPPSLIMWSFFLGLWNFCSFISMLLIFVNLLGILIHQPQLSTARRKSSCRSWRRKWKRAKRTLVFSDGWWVKRWHLYAQYLCIQIQRVYTNIIIYIYTDIYIHTHVTVYICTYVYIHTCTHFGISIQTLDYIIYLDTSLIHMVDLYICAVYDVYKHMLYVKTYIYICIHIIYTHTITTTVFTYAHTQYMHGINTHTHMYI